MDRGEEGIFSLGDFNLGLGGRKYTPPVLKAFGVKYDHSFGSDSAHPVAHKFLEAPKLCYSSDYLVYPCCDVLYVDTLALALVCKQFVEMRGTKYPL